MDSTESMGCVQGVLIDRYSTGLYKDVCLFVLKIKFMILGLRYADACKILTVSMEFVSDVHQGLFIKNLHSHA